MTSLNDDTVGAGFDPLGRPQTDTDGFYRAKSVQPAGSFEIEVNYGPVIRERPQYVEAIELATRYWERQIEDPIRIVLDIELDENLLNGPLGVASASLVNLEWDTVRQALIDDGREHEIELLSQLPIFADASFTIPEDSIDPFSVSSSMTIARANALALGIDPAFLPAPTSQYDATELTDGSIHRSNFRIPLLQDIPQRSLRRSPRHIGSQSHLLVRVFLG